MSARRGSPDWLSSVVVAVGLSVAACHSTTASPATPRVVEDAATCDARKRGFSDFVASLPSRAVATPSRVDMPVSTLGAVPGNGPLVEMSPSLLVLDGTVVTETDTDARLRRFEQWIAASVAPAAAPSGAHRARSVLYVAASADLDVRSLRTFLVLVPKTVELRLLVRVPAQGAAKPESGPPDLAVEVASRLLLEPDPNLRNHIATDAYTEFAKCPSLTSALSSVGSKNPRDRWPLLQSAFVAELPSCDCSHLDTTSLRQLVSAEQRAGAATFGWLPFSFIRDERCEATMPLRSMKKLVLQMEAFDEAFAGDFQRDALKFDDVLVDSRLRVNFCEAIPGDTLAAEENAEKRVFLRGADASCEAWTFAPLAKGSPMGTMKRASKGAPLSFHYWQAVEELRVFGPLDDALPSKPTDDRDWPCEITLHLTAVDEDGLGFEKARWFFSEAACNRSPSSDPGFEGCVADIAARTR